MKTIRTDTLFRSVTIDDAQRSAMDKDKRTVELSFSSEEPVERWFGNEILDHESKSVDLSRLNNRGPLLLEHDRTQQIGVIERAWLDPKEKKGRALVRFGSSPLASQIFQDVVDGIRSLVSVGYRVAKLVTESVENEVETLRAMSWQPMEISIVSVPADTSVGIGRGENTGTNETEIDDSRTMKFTKPLLDKATDTGGGKDSLDNALAIDAEARITEARNHQDKLLRAEFAEVQSIVDKMRVRYPDILALQKRHTQGDLSLPEFRVQAFALMHNATPVDYTREQNLGMSDKDLSRYSWRNAIMMASDPKIEGFERELSRAAVDKYRIAQRGPNTIVVPQDVLNWSQRDQLVGTGSLGGNVVATNLLASSFIDVLRNRMLVARAGATMLSGLVGQVAIPRQSGAASTFWAASEAASTTESSVTFDQVTLQPKQITARVDYSWLLLQQSTPAVDGLIRSDFQNVIARAIDLAALHGSGASGQPTGVASTSGIGSVTGGTNGAAPTWANIVGLETEVAIDNADIGTLAYLTNARVRGKLKTTLKGGTTATDGIYIWPEGPIADGFALLNGYRIGTTNQVASNLTKGTSTTVASAIFFGNWADLLIGMWSGLELLTNPYTQASTRVIETYAYQAVDIAVRHPESFAAMLDALTT